jgi:hypothetical protein
MSVVAAMLFVASTALAGQVNLAWNNCASEGGVQARTSACAVNTGSNVLVGSFVPNIDQPLVTGIEIVIDIIVGDGTSTIPDWWDSVCRGTLVAVNGTVNPLNSVCVDWANGQSAGGLAAYTAAYTPGAINPVNYPAHRRIIAGFAVAAANAAAVTAGSEYFGCNVLINNAKSVGPGSCAGCSTPACIVLNSVNVVNGITSHDFVFGGGAASQVTWQGTGPSCALVPTKNATWGQVKALYH